MVNMAERRPSNNQPLAKAAETRRRITAAVLEDRSFQIIVPSEVASCILGLPNKVFKKHFSTLFYPQEDGVGVFAADSQEVALQALRNWQTEPIHSKAKKQFDRAMYMSLYRLIQAVQNGIGQQEMQGTSKLFLTLLEEVDNSIYGVGERIDKKGIIEEQDMTILHQKLRQLWDTLSHASKKTIESFNPNNLFI